MQKKNTKKRDKINIHYLKNPLYRSIHVDGLIGGLTPRGKISISFYAERLAIPKCEEYKLNETGQVGVLDKVSDDSKDGIVREVEFEAYFDINTIKDFKKWLEIKIDEYEKHFPSTKK